MLDRRVSDPDRADVDVVADSQVPTWLVPASFGYLALPTAIFLVGWTRPVVALVGLASLAAMSVLLVRKARSGDESAASAASVLPGSTSVAIWLTAVVTGFATGAGGYMPQSWDWLKHNAMLRDLVLQEWPVSYAVDDQSFRLTYYIGYYLPAAAVGKVAGWPAANAVLLAWTVLGLAIAFTWFCVLARAAGRVWILLVAVFFSGLDAVGRVLYPVFTGLENETLPSLQLDWWAHVGKYPNHLTSVMWGPHHALGGWVAAGLVVHLTKAGRIGWLTPVVALSGLLSPFVALGLLPLVGWTVVRDGRDQMVDRLRSLASLPAALATVAVLPVLAYYAALLGSMPPPYDGSVEFGFALTEPIRPMGFGSALSAYLLLIVLEVLVFWVIVRRSPVGSEPDSRLLLAIAAGTMVLFPLLRYGKWSDLAMRAVVPSMFVLSILVARMVLESPRASRLRTAVLIVLAIGLVAPAMELGRLVTDTHARGIVVRTGFYPDDIDESAGIVTLSETVYRDQPRFLAQYTATDGSFFSRTIARDPG